MKAGERRRLIIYIYPPEDTEEDGNSPELILGQLQSCVINHS